MNILESHIEAGQALAAKDRREYYTAVVEYLAYGREPKLSGAAAAVFIAIRPNLDASRARAEAGRVGGSKPASKPASRPEANGQANAKQTASKPPDGEEADGHASAGQSASKPASRPEANGEQTAKLLGIGIGREKRTPKGVPKERSGPGPSKPEAGPAPAAGEVGSGAPVDAFAAYA